MVLGGVLPKFSNPPLAEVALGVQFDPLPFQIIHFGGFFERVRKSYPKVSTLPPVPVRMETFESSGSPVMPFFFQPPGALPRVWYAAEDQVTLIQMQSDRLVFNWRRQEGGPPYPHYEVLQDGFTSAYEELSRYCEHEGFGTPVPNQCEVNYINWIEDSPETPLSSLEKVFRFLNAPVLTARSGLEDTSYGASYRLLNSEGIPFARLQVNLQARIGNNQQRLMSLELSARGAPMQPNMSGVRGFHDTAREAIVHAFADLTTINAQAFWERHT